ncbi:hypothetical protein ACIP5N_27555 [Streptomyces sp. NPDC088768]
MNLRDALKHHPTRGGDDDNGGHGDDNTDIEEGDGQGGSGSPGHNGR